MNIQIKNSETQYGLIARLLHWTSVILLVALIYISGQFSDMKPSAEKTKLIIQHSSIGLIFFILMLSRFTWRQVNKNPIKSYNIKNWQKFSAIFLHICIYLFIISQSFIGILILLTSGDNIHFFNLFQITYFMDKNTELNDLFTSSHAYFSNVVYPLFAVHILAAIYHQIFGVIEGN